MGEKEFNVLSFQERECICISVTYADAINKKEKMNLTSPYAE